MPAFGDEIAAYNDSPDQVEADDGIIDVFYENKDPIKITEPEVPSLAVNDKFDDVDMIDEHESAASNSSRIKSSILNEQFLRQLRRVQSDQRRILRFEKEIEKNEEEIERQLLDLNLTYLVSPYQNVEEIDDSRLQRLSAKDQNQKLLEAGKAAIKQKFDKLADIIDKQDAVFRGEEPSFKLKKHTD